MYFNIVPSILAALLTAKAVSAQTYTTCNPLQQSCPPNPALGRSLNVDFTSESSDFTASGGSITYGADGAALTINGQGQAPTITSSWFLLFGRVDVTMKAAPGTGIVSSIVLQSIDLDEIDSEFLGGDTSQFQSNYFGKGITGGYDRGAFHPVNNPQNEFHTYTMIWDANQVVWQLDGQTVRVLTAAQAGNQYPQTPMQLKLGSWAGGDPSNAPGTISWAGGPTNYGSGPFTMYVKSVSAQDYSTGSEYRYGDTSGTWQSIIAVGGSVGTAGNANGVDTSDMPQSSSTSGQPVPFSGTHSTATGPQASCYTGRPDGWTCSSTGKLLPPSAGSQTLPTSLSLPSQASPSASASSSAERSKITGAPEPAVTKIPPMVGTTNATTRATPSTTLPVPTNQQQAAPPVSTGAAVMQVATSRLSTVLGAVFAAAFWL